MEKGDQKQMEELLTKLNEHFNKNKINVIIHNGNCLKLIDCETEKEIVANFLIDLPTINNMKLLGLSIFDIAKIIESKIIEERKNKGDF